MHIPGATVSFCEHMALLPIENTNIINYENCYLKTQCMHT